MKSIYNIFNVYTVFLYQFDVIKPAFLSSFINIIFTYSNLVQRRIDLVM